MNKEEFTIQGSNQRLMLCDLRYITNSQKKPLIIFVHGFKGFKDWGHFNLVADEFAINGFAFLKFNFSHNGTTINSPVELIDSEAFGNNNLVKELYDLNSVIDFIKSNYQVINHLEIDVNNIYLIGHSRGGGISILNSATDNRIKKLITLASVSQFGNFLNKDKYEEWKEKGVISIINTRTKQELPMYWQYMEALKNNYEKLNILERIKEISIPYLCIHGDNDEAVDYKNAERLKFINNSIELLKIKNANHTFGAIHPWIKTDLPYHTQEWIKASIKFLND